MTIELLHVDCMEYMRGRYYDEDGIATYKKVNEMIGAHSQTEIASKLGKNVAVINRMCKEGYEPHKTNARYFSDFSRNTDWFMNL